MDTVKKTNTRAKKTEIKEVETSEPNIETEVKKVRKSRFAKGSKEASDYMKELRAKRKPKETKSV